MFTLDAYAARSCPVKTHNAFHPGLTLPEADEGLREVFHGGVAFEAEVLAALLAGFDGSVFDGRELAGLPSGEQERAALQAMRSGVEVLIGPLLPRDPMEHRSGRPDLLLRDQAGGYHPGEIKFHRVSDPRGGGSTLTWSALSDPLRRRVLEGHRFRYTWRLNDLLQLAHYQRMLLRLGLAASEPLAAVVGSDELPGLGRVLSWVDLGAAVLPPSPRTPPDPAQVSALRRYDAEHAFRVEIAETASALSPDDPPALLPIANRECGWCQWWDVCRPQLDDDDLSLRISKSPLDVHEIRVLRDLGVATVAELAACDLDELLPRYLPRITHRVGAEERLRLAWRRSVLMARGVDFDRVTEGPIELPQAPIEIDLDIETSSDDRVYLWGFLVDDGSGRPWYRHFSAFTDLDDDAEQALADAAMRWLRETVGDHDALVFHYSDYELIRMQRLADATGSEPLAWALDWARQHFVDLFTVIRTHFFGTQGLGLKVVASKAAGFSWRDAAPGGLNSQSWFTEAVTGDTEELRTAARRRVLEYNEDDVEATWHVRRWLRSPD
ncbi:MAG: TM0106 family RecB-like putative nuclease [Micropruina sp.]|uniref:TM0106 family RecB-like putative nuclease n=1 Tax=Micropruina sp. TaxID=2737536 RepID=UPI0039E3D925